MKLKFKKQIVEEREVFKIRANVNIRYSNGFSINGEDRAESEFENLPCFDAKLGKSGRWNILIDVKTGIISDWKNGISVEMHAKVCDDGFYTFYDNEGNVIYESDNYEYVPLFFPEQHYGDYLILSIDETGKITNWKEGEFNYNNFDEE